MSESEFLKIPSEKLKSIDSVIISVQNFYDANIFNFDSLVTHRKTVMQAFLKMRFEFTELSSLVDRHINSNVQDELNVLEEIGDIEDADDYRSAVLGFILTISDFCSAKSIAQFIKIHEEFTDSIEYLSEFTDEWETENKD